MNSPTQNDKKWFDFITYREEIVDELQAIAEELSGRERTRVQGIARWLQSHSNFRLALFRPDILAVFIPFFQSTRAVADSNFEEMVRSGLNNLSQSRSPSDRLQRLLLYPAIIFVVACLILVFFSRWILPEFETLFEGFGIALPKSTELVLALGGFIRTFDWVITGVLVGGIGMFFLLPFLNRSRWLARPSGLDQFLAGKRSSLGSWAWHISLLMRCGLSFSNSVQIACASSGRRRIKGWKSVERALAGKMLNRKRYRLMRVAFEIEPAEQKILALQQAAIIYWDASRETGDWWIQLFATLLLLLIAVGILLMVGMLFSPLFNLITGLV